MNADARIASLRWAKVNSRKKIHLWLGSSTACGLLYGEDVHRLEVTYPNPACPRCHAYARGWLDHHDTGDRPTIGASLPDPTGADTHLALAVTR
jgi:hypothetical protein